MSGHELSLEDRAEILALNGPLTFLSGTTKVDWKKGERDMLRCVFGASRQEMIDEAVKRVLAREWPKRNWLAALEYPGYVFVKVAAAREFSRIASGAA